ncbi:hypothetical protein B0T12DRAFT_490545 [Alternaria alternata]|nr:hypothetical protein B0T12DRAFT_490545 [Alternaria alternata]
MLRAQFAEGAPDELEPPEPPETQKLLKKGRAQHLNDHKTAQFSNQNSTFETPKESAKRDSRNGTSAIVRNADRSTRRKATDLYWDAHYMAMRETRMPWMRKTLPNISYRKTQTTLEKVEREQYKMRFLYQRHPRSMENIDQRGQGKEDDGESGARLHSQLGCFRMSSTFGKIVPAAPRPPATPSLRRAYSNTMKASKRRKHTKIGIDPKRTSTSIARPSKHIFTERLAAHLYQHLKISAPYKRTKKTPKITVMSGYTAGTTN